MRVDEGLQSRSEGDAPVVLTIGNFDGVHRGHVALLDEVRAAARPLDAQTAVLTFDPNPRCVLDPGRCPQSLTTAAEKADLLARHGVDRLAVLGFNRSVSSWSAEHFCDLLCESFDLRVLVVGHDFALGHKRQGDITFLRDYGARHDFTVTQVSEVGAAEGGVSSSRIRQLVSGGEVRAAAELLGRPYFMDARVERGAEAARHLGYPTANLSVAASKCLPDRGVYAMWVRVEERWHMAATNVGYRAMFGGDRLTVEAFILDLPVDVPAELYDREVRAVFVERLREEREYTSRDELVAQIAADVAQARELLSGRPPPAL